MRNDFLIAGELHRRLEEAVRSLPVGIVRELTSPLLQQMAPVLDEPLSAASKLYGLQLSLKGELTMCHSGWLYGRYSEASERLSVRQNPRVAVFQDGAFRFLGQFSCIERTMLFLGFDDTGEKLLGVIEKAERDFLPKKFDSDGYIR